MMTICQLCSNAKILHTIFFKKISPHTQVITLCEDFFAQVTGFFHSRPNGIFVPLFTVSSEAFLPPVQPDESDHKGNLQQVKYETLPCRYRKDSSATSRRIFRM